MDSPNSPAHEPHLPTAAMIRALWDQVQTDYPYLAPRGQDYLMACRCVAAGFAVEEVMVDHVVRRVYRTSDDLDLFLPIPNDSSYPPA